MYLIINCFFIELISIDSFSIGKSQLQLKIMLIIRLNSEFYIKTIHYLLLKSLTILLTAIPINTIIINRNNKIKQTRNDTIRHVQIIVNYNKLHG